jgi:hypothetical protein
MSGHALHPEAYGDLDDIRGYIAQLQHYHYVDDYEIRRS